MRIDQLLVQRGLASTRSQAQRLIAGGVEWQQADVWRRVTKNGDNVPEDAELRLLDDSEARYVSRGGLKLEAALARVGLSVDGKQCLDVGQSTGGFTDCLLQHGASFVVGVDVGSAQLHPKLHADPRVLCVESLNARALDASDLIAAYADSISASGHFDLEAEDEDDDDDDDSEDNDALRDDTEDSVAADSSHSSGEQGSEDAPDSEDVDSADTQDAEDSGRAASADSDDERDEDDEDAEDAEDGAESNFNNAFVPEFDVIVADLSFISQTLVLPAVVPLLKAGGTLLTLVKPQFELQPGQVGKGGIVKDAAMYQIVEQRLRDACAELGLTVTHWFDSPITGGDGNREFFIAASKP